ncbi:MAG: DUF2125 domain-containing protein [Boseongicola sp.]|nr:DUF2125 domain-containing protein [Boseongicola sp.]
MTFLRICTTTSAFALVAGPAFAELTAQDVWTDWKDLLDSYGADISTGSEDQSGDTLTVTGLSTTFAVQGGSMALDLGDISFAEQGDGSVVVTLADTLPMIMDITGPDGKQGKVGFTISQPGNRMVVSGDPGKMRYDFEYPSILMSDFTIEGDDVPEDMPMVFDMAMTDMTGFATVTDGDVRSYESDATIGLFTLNMDIDDPDEGSGTIKISMSDLTQSVRGTLAEIAMDMSAAELIEAGMTQVGTGAYGPSTMQFAFDGPDGALEMAAAAEGGTLDMSFDENGINYGGVTNGITMTVGGTAIPFPPMSFAMDKSEGRVVMPMVPNPDEEQDFGLRMTLEGLKIDDMLWGMFDPAGQLPRDPATIIVDLGGSAVVTEDFTNPEYAENMNAAPPGTLETLDVNALQLTFAGAELTGDGDFAFNNEMGMPLPSGTANLMLTGGNGLLDTLVTMGLVPEDQAMGARMMLGLFARPGDGPDTLVSTIEVNEDGSILANGQRIK